MLILPNASHCAPFPCGVEKLTNCLPVEEIPPSCNTGGTPPLSHSQTNNSEGPKNQKTIIDTVSWTFKAPVTSIKSLVLESFPEGCEWAPETRGQHGYTAQVQLVSNSLVLGWLAFGAKHPRNWLYLTGAGLLHRREHGLTDESLAEFCGAEGARLGRVDIALDIFEHSVFSVEQSIAAHEAGDYRLPRAPGNIHSELFQSSTNCSDFEVARTHYLGRRNASKRLRVYDKGLQILGSLTKEELAECRALGVLRAHEAPDESRIEEWTRVELIYKHDKRRPLSRDMIVSRDKYFAGAYPLLQKLLTHTDGVRPSYIPREEDCDHARLLLAHRESYGGHLYFLRNELGWSDAKIVRCLIGNKPSARLMIEREAGK